MSPQPPTACLLLQEAGTKEKVSPFGPRNPRLIIVGEAPDSVARQFKKPYQGKQGMLLHKLLDENGIDPTQVTYLYAAPCASQTMERNKKEAAIKASQPYVRFILGLFDDSIPVLALGSLAAQSLGAEINVLKQTFIGKQVMGAVGVDEVLHNGERYVHLERAIQKIARPVKTWPEPTAWTVVNHPDELPDIDRGVICLDIEGNTVDWSHREGHYHLLGVAAPREKDSDPRKTGADIWIITDDVIGTDAFKLWLQTVWFTNKVGGHNFKFDNKVMLRQSDSPAYHDWDTILMVQQIHEHWEKGLKELSSYYFNVTNWQQTYIDSWFAENKVSSTKQNYADVPTDRIHPYLARDVYWNLLLYYELKDELHKLDRWEKPYQNYEIPLTNTLMRIEFAGMPVDLEVLQEFEIELAAEVSVLRDIIEDYTKGTITNPNSHKQVQTYLWDIAKYPHPKGQPVSRSSSRQVLDAIEEENGNDKFIKLLQSFRRISKIKSSYVTNLFPFLRTDRQGGVYCHPTYKQAFVKTGRLSAVDPAIQTIPRPGDKRDVLPTWLVEEMGTRGVKWRGAYGRRIKQVYAAPPGYSIVAADGSQWELRTAAAWSRDPWLLDQYRQFVDVHGSACDVAYGVGLWGSPERAEEKRVMFALLYGGHLESLMSISTMTPEQKQGLFNFFYNHLSVLLTWRTEMFEMASRDNIIVSPLNRAYHFDVATDSNLRDLMKWAVNYPVQGTAAQITNTAMVNAERFIRQLGGYLIGNKHDEIIALVPEGKEAAAGEQIGLQLSKAGYEAFDILPWVAEAEAGPNWGELKTLFQVDIQRGITYGN